jgi:glyoxylase-like metal-dependent hydrolase (beta-lactamase superfamily II)
VLATPGHTPGHLAFLDTRDGTLYAGDAFTATRGVATSAVVPWRYPMAGLATWNRSLDLESARRAMTRAIAAAARKIQRTPHPPADPGR